MSKNTLFLVVAYDLEENKVRSHLAEVLQYYGLSRIQYSVFAGELTVRNMEKMNDTLFGFDLHDDDNITVFPICEKCKKNIRTIKPLPKQLKHLSI